MVSKLLELADKAASRFVPSTTASATGKWCLIDECSPDGGLVLYWCVGKSSTNCTCSESVCADHV